MKKSLIALAALATVATAAQAQSSVTIYGIVDLGILGVSKTTSDAGRLTAVASGPLSTSRLGFKGTEDLGGGLKANFTLESELNADVGSNDSVLFKRGAWVQLDQANVGSVTLGRQNRLDYAATASMDPWSAANVGGFISAGYLGGLAVAAGNVRVDNAVTLQTAKFGGLSAAYQYAFGEVAGNASKSKTDALNLDLVQGALRVNYSHVERKDSSGVRAERGDFTYASYDFGFVKPVIGYIETQATATSVKNKVTLVGASAPVNANTTALLGYYDHKNAGASAGKDGQTYSLGLTYALSKRTTLYGLTAFSNVDAGTVLAVSNNGTQHNQANNVPAGLNQSVYAVGVRHSF